jgi:hypothetical protein
MDEACLDNLRHHYVTPSRRNCVTIASLLRHHTPQTQKTNQAQHARYEADKDRVNEEKALLQSQLRDAQARLDTELPQLKVRSCVAWNAAKSEVLGTKVHGR